MPRGRQFKQLEPLNKDAVWFANGRCAWCNVSVMSMDDKAKTCSPAHRQAVYRWKLRTFPKQPKLI